MTRIATANDKKMIIIVTDGHENASKEYITTLQIQNLIKERENEGWAFVFLASGITPERAQAVYQTGVATGMSASNVTFDTHINRAATYQKTSKATADFMKGTVSNTAVFDEPEAGESTGATRKSSQRFFEADSTS